MARRQATRPTRFTALAAAAFAIAVLGLLMAGCSDYGNSGSQMSQSLAASSDPARFSERVTDPGIAAQLDSAPTDSGILYPAGDGSALRLVLGPPYVSGRGITCRTGRPAGLAVGERTPLGIFAFCRAPDGWYKTRPILLSNR
ncbi:MAG: hypothetical protein JO038_09910 [Alphaproteobacteria bacterium]|nr:hypothetical protein [Alphaproteobacteria bacterium]